MYVQFSENLPGVVIDEGNKKISVDNSGDLSSGFAHFFEDYLSGELERFRIEERFASGFYKFCEMAKAFKRFETVKAQIIGPISFGLSIVDQSGRSLIYDDNFKELILKLLEMKAKWQIKHLKEISSGIALFIDEPYLANFGSTFLNIEREGITESLNTIIDALHKENVCIGIHCCGNTDWSLLASTHTDIISFDSYGFSGSLALYPEQLRSFLQRGGFISWGAVPSSEVVLTQTSEALFKRLVLEIKKVSQKGIPIDLIFKNSLITPSCGLGTLTPELAEVIIEKTLSVSKLAQQELHGYLEI